jgi:alpha-tubulin suppressor-like RCC1 family protein
VPGVDGAIAIAGQGSNFSCAVLLDGSVRCWGSVAGAIDANADTPMTVSGVTTTARGIAAGFHHACAVSPGGDTIQCWGLNNNGELGDGPTNGNTVTVRGLAGRASAVSAGFDHTCALLADGHVQCWGHNVWGQLGNGTRDASLAPVTVSGISDAVAVSAGYMHTCMLTATGSVRCWGRGGEGQLGNGETTQTVPTPVTVIGF